MSNPEVNTPVHRRRWPRLAAFTAIPIAGALSIYAFLPKAPKPPMGQASGCDHSASPASGQACPHGMDANGGCNMAANAAPDGQPQGASQAPPRSLEWVLPKGWISELHQGGMRYATLRPAGQDKVDVSVVPLGGSAGGELANVNRWREQIGLDPIADKELVALRTRVNTQAGPVTVFDLGNPKNPMGRMVVGMLLTNKGDTWFVKMVGEHGSVAETKPAFLTFLGSLRKPV